MSRQTWSDGDALLAAELQQVQDEAVIVVATSTERDTLPSSVKMCWLSGTLYKRSGGGTWEAMAKSGDHPGLTGSGASGTWPIAITGNAASATKLATTRSISLVGDVTGSVSFNGTANVSITTTVADNSHSHSSVGYATSAGNADTVDGYHAGSFSLTSHTHTRTSAGYNIVNFDAGSLADGATGSWTVAHGLGQAPGAAFTNAFHDDGNMSIVTSVNYWDATNITVLARNVGGATESFWISVLVVK